MLTDGPSLLQPSRNDLLTWINTLTKSSYTKIQQLGTGIAYSQILDQLHPHSINSHRPSLAKINLKAKSQYQFINNFKLLQQCFTKMGIYKNIEIEKLVKCKYQDNLEFLQWFHKYFEGMVNRGDTLNRSLSRYENRSLPKRTSSFNPSTMVSNNISKIQSRGMGIENGSFEDVLDDLGKTNPQTSLDQKMDYYKNKLFEIQELVDCWDENSESEVLKEKILEIIKGGQQEDLLNDLSCKNSESGN